MMFKGTFLIIAAQYIILASAQNFSCEQGKRICLSDPSGCSPADCNLIAAVERKDEKTFTFHIAGKGSKESYISIGLSSNEAMGKDAVVACFHNGVNSFINPDKTEESEKLNWGGGSLRKSVTAVTGDRITCSFDLPSKIKAGPGISFDLNSGNQIYLFAATGPGNTRKLKRHGPAPLVLKIIPSSLTSKTHSHSGAEKGNTSTETLVQYLPRDVECSTAISIGTYGQFIHPLYPLRNILNVMDTVFEQQAKQRSRVYKEILFHLFGLILLLILTITIVIDSVNSRDEHLEQIVVSISVLVYFTFPASVLLYLKYVALEELDTEKLRVWMAWEMLNMGVLSLFIGFGTTLMLPPPFDFTTGTTLLMIIYWLPLIVYKTAQILRIKKLKEQIELALSSRSAV